jgi:glycosyltransferase involved in cell wall biosynthesis
MVPPTPTPPSPPPLDPNDAHTPARNDTRPGDDDASHAAYLGERHKRDRSRAPSRRLRIAIAHDWLVGMRGGELVLDRIAAIIAQDHIPADLWVLFHKPRATTPALERFDVRASRLNAIPGGRGPLRRWLLPLYPSAIEAMGDRLARAHAEQPIDLVISTSSGLIKGLAAPEGVPHLCYCHTPARYIWTRQDSYTTGGGAGAALRKLGFDVFTDKLRAWDRKTVANVSMLLANSTHTAREIERCWGRSSTVVHPPVRTGLFTIDPSTEREDYWLVVTALEPYKRTELAIDAAQLAGKRLLIAGTGSQAKRLRAHAKAGAKRLERAGMTGRASLVQFLGRVTTEQLTDLYRRASVLLFPQVEDFGIVAVEAQACGCPVVARREGGALDTVLEGRTGAFFDRPEPKAVIDAVQRVPQRVARQCRANAERFGEVTFDRAIERAIASIQR